MGVTRINTQDIKDGSVATADLAAASVTFVKLAVAASEPCLEADGSGNTRVAVDGTSIIRTGGSLNVNPTTNGGLEVTTGLQVKGFATRTSAPGIPTAGDGWFNSSTKSFEVSKLSTMKESLVGLLFAGGPSSYVTNTTSLTTADVSYTLAAGYLVAGKVLRIRVGGTYTASGANPTLSISLYLNNPTAGIQGVGASLGTLGSGSFDFNVILVVRTAGASGTFGSSGYAIMAIGTGTQIFATSDTGRSCDTTIANSMCCLFQWGAASASNKVRLETFVIEALN